MAAVIRIENLRFRYPEAPTDAPLALDGIDLRIDAGEYVAIIGHNGSGKSTLARHLNALLLPTQGDVWVEGMNTREARWRLQIRQIVGMVFQNPESQLVATTVEDDVAFGPENLGLPADEIEQRVEDALRRVGMLSLRLRPPHQLSSGQKQRVAIAGVLAMRPRCLVLDEATSLLDPLGREDVLNTVHNLHQEGITIVAVTHSMLEASLADRVIVLAQGQIALDGSPREVFRQKQRLRAMGLDVPPMLELSQLLRRRIPGFPDDRLTPDEMVAALESLRYRVAVPAAAS